MEGSPILYGENTIGIDIRGYGGELGPRIVNFGFENDDGTFSKDIPTPLKSFKRFQVAVQMPLKKDTTEMFRISNDVRTVAAYLENTVIHHLGLHLLYRKKLSKHDFKLLSEFREIRNVRSLVIFGAPFTYSDTLGKLIIGNTPRQELDTWYKQLADYVKGFDGLEDDLGRAQCAIKRFDIKRFQLIRERMVFEVKKQMEQERKKMEERLLHLCDLDAKIEEAFPALEVSYNLERCGWHMKK